MEGNKLVKSSLHLVPFTFVKLLTLVRNPMDVHNVGKPTLLPVTFILMKAFTV
jgi:hypothetical protein